MKTMNLKIVVVTVLVCFGMVNVSNAQSQQERKPKQPPTFAQLLEDLDTNEDGKLEKSEIKGPLKNDFETVDTDEDGFITAEELEKAPKPQRPERGPKN